MISTIILVLSVHWFADFILQTNWMAINKSKELLPLYTHVFVYSLPMLIFGWRFAVFNGACHLITDSITSRITSILWSKNERHWFFIIIGLDQLIHTNTLLVSGRFLGLF